MKIMLLAGGTGGHIFPAIALAKSLAGLGAETAFVGRPASLEERLVRLGGFAFHPLPASGFFGKGPLQKAAFFFRFGLGLVLGARLISTLRPDAIVAAGGFTALAPLVAAVILKRKFFLLEQNRVPGRLTRYLSGFARLTFLNFPTERTLKGTTELSGNPLRPEITRAGRATDGRRTDGRTVLFMGGSQGAHRLNLAALEAARRLAGLRFIVQTGERDYEFVVKNHSANLTPVAFTAAPEELYSRADLVVSRAGATALAEMLCLGLPVILVPFPFATDQHQLANARYLERAGAAVLLTEDRLEELPALIERLMADGSLRAALARKARALGRPDSARQIARRILACSAA